MHGFPWQEEINDISQVAQECMRWEHQGSAWGLGRGESNEKDVLTEAAFWDRIEPWYKENSHDFTKVIFLLSYDFFQGIIKLESMCPNSRVWFNSIYISNNWQLLSLDNKDQGVNIQDNIFVCVTSLCLLLLEYPAD